MVTAFTRGAARVGLLVGSLLAGCEEETLTRRRPDIGVRDAGSAAPLALETGMRFTYQATLTFRGEGAMSEGSARYEVGFSVQDTTDRGPGESAITVTGTGQNQLDMSWTDDKDLFPWAARLGPARSADTLNMAPVEVALDDIPSIPPRSGPRKPLPAPGTFFVDVRDMEALRAAWSEVHADQRPRVVDPENNGGRWLFAYEGPDPTLVTFPSDARRRSVRLEYDPRGFLVTLSEVLGPEDPMGLPRATANLTLTDGPD